MSPIKDKGYGAKKAPSDNLSRLSRRNFEWEQAKVVQYTIREIL